MSPKFFQRKTRAFAFSADVVLALILVTSLFVFLSAPTQPSPKLEERRVADQYVDDLFVALDHSGFMSQELDVNGYSSTTLQNVYARATSLLPSSYDVYLTLTRYPVDVNSCRVGQDFASCFPDVNVSSLNYGTPLTSSASFVHGRRIFLQQQPASQCTATPSPVTSSWPLALYPTRDPYTANFTPSVNLTFDVNVSPSGPLTCDQNITVSLQVSGNTGSRKPVDMMLVFDRSGSMSWDGQEDTTDAFGIDIDTNTAYIADSTSGLRDINIVNYGLPNLVGTYNSPGTARDVDVNGAYAYLADGASGLRIVSVSSSSAPSSTAQLDVGGDAYAVLAQDVNTYIATFGATTIDQSNTPASNRDLAIGQNAANASAAQSFQPSLDFITGATVYVRKVGSPGVNLQVNLRSSLAGANLTSTTITAASLTTSYQDINVSFPAAYPLTSGSTYYIVLTTSSNDATNYYQWGARNTNGYANGTAYQTATNQNYDARFDTRYITGLISVDTSTKATPSVFGAALLTDPWRMTLVGRYLYVADGSSGVRIFDIRGGNPSLVGSYNTPGTAYDVWVSGSYAYVSDGTSGLRILDISNPTSPTSVGTYNTPGTAYATRVSGNYAYIADGSSLQVIDVSTPASPVFVKSYATPYNYRDLEIQGGWGFIAVDASIEGIMTFDLGLGPKINQAQFAAQTFVDFNGWDANNDQMGLVSYSSSATLDQTLTYTYSLVKSDINALVAGGGTATGDGVNAATNHLLANQIDVSNTGAQNQVLTIGQNASNTYAGQSFQPNMPYLNSLALYVRRVGNPSVPLTVEIRSSISGSVIASTTIPVASISTSYVLRTATFSTPPTLTPGTTYYIVLSTSSNNASNYYQWGAQSPSTYAGGQAYQNATAQATWDARFASYGQYSNPSALKFEILMSDGLTNTGASSATAAITAANNGIIIYAIGFSAEADVAELTNIANTTGGKYYTALDQNALIDVYSLIAQQIQLIATDANVIASIPAGTTVIDDGNGTLVGGNIIFDINTQTPQPWTSTYTFNIPCTSTLACSSTLISVPSPGTQFQYVDANGNSITIDWNVFDTASFNYRDLNVEILSGNLVGTNNTDLTVKVSSVGNQDTNSSLVSFYQSDPSFGNLITSATIPALCGSLVPGCVTPDYTFTHNVAAEGELWAVVNPNQTIPECTYNDRDVLFCYQNPSTQFFTLDYWVWLHE